MGRFMPVEGHAQADCHDQSSSAEPLFTNICSHVEAKSARRLRLGILKSKQHGRVCESNFLLHDPASAP